MHIQMNSLVDLAVLIPFLPFFSALFVLTLLISFNRTINRLTKPISLLLISSIFASTFYSFVILIKHISARISIPLWNFFQFDNPLYFLFNDSSELLLSISGLIALIIMIFSYLKLPRSKGYVRYMSVLTFIFSCLFFLLLIDPISTLTAFFI